MSELCFFSKWTLTAWQMSTAPELPKELPEDDPDDVLFNSLYGVRTIELNRPKKLNSLNASMVRKILPRLKVHNLRNIFPGIMS